MYITVHTAAPTMAMPDTNMMSTSPLKSSTISPRSASRTPDGNAQKIRIAIPVVVKTIRSRSAGGMSPLAKKALADRPIPCQC